MDADRWQRLNEIFESALERQGDDRLAFVKDACSGDPDLGRDVEVLLNAHQEAGRFLSRSYPGAPRPEVPEAPALTPGTRLGPYEVTDRIGQGGMGEVYRARDTTLDRDVALKVLPSAFTEDPDRLARFEREAKVMASLSHPNIGSIHGLEEQGGTRALVLELVEGPTLAERIAEGPVPFDEALPIANQIAEALESAHEHGVIHRDLKPANIKLRPDGTVKVLDFGLAKALDTTPEGDRTQSPTLTAVSMRMGLILGTAAYVSPEQARGKTVDERADIWSFGCIVYEMLTGRRAFDGETVADTLAGVLDRVPAWDALAPDVPVGVTRVIRRCLVKDVRGRLRNMGDARLELTEAGSGVPEDGATSVGAAIRPALVWLPWGAAAAGVLVALAAWISRPLVPAPPPVRFSLTADVGGQLHATQHSHDLAISADGGRIAYLSGGTGESGDFLRLRLLGELAATTLVEGGNVSSPFFSPDGASVGFFDTRRPARLRRVSTEGGPASTICDFDGDLRGAAWGPDDTIVFGSTNKGGLWRVPAAGGDPERLTSSDVERGDVDHRWPIYLPGGDTVLFTIARSPIEESVIAALSLDTGEQRVILRGGSYPRYSPTGHLLYAVQETIWAVRFDPVELETAGNPFVVQEGVVTKMAGAANYDVSANGSLVYMPSGAARLQAPRSLVWVDETGGEEALPAPPALYESPRLSPDGRRIAVEVRDPENADVFIYDIDENRLTRLTFDSAVDRYPLWSPDGKRVLFASDRDGSLGVYSKEAGGTGQAQRLFPSESTHWPQSLAPDGRNLVVGYNPPGPATFDLYVVALDREERQVLVATEFAESNAAISPAGRWIAYQSSESGRAEIHVRPFPTVTDGGWQVSVDGGVAPAWAADGGTLFFRRERSWEMLAVQLDSQPTFRWGEPQTLFEAPYLFTSGAMGRTRSWDVAADGRFLMVKELSDDDGEEDAPHIVVAVNALRDAARAED